jgi:hypothetical protein
MESACNSKKPTSTQDADSTFPIFTFDNDCLLFSKPDGTSKEQKKAQVTQNLASFWKNFFPVSFSDVGLADLFFLSLIDELLS